MSATFTAHDTVRRVLEGRACQPIKAEGRAFAPSNIALVKYWGKRDTSLNLPVTSSLSISLGTLGTDTRIACVPGDSDRVALNGSPIAPSDSFAQAITRYLDLIRPPGHGFNVDTTNSIPTAAGLASSASGFAALVRALDDLFGWRLPSAGLSILARLGSGSASRSVLRGFVEWDAGVRPDGLDSFARLYPESWPDLRIGLLTLSSERKAVGSRDAMRRTVETSPLYTAWPATVAHDLEALKRAISDRDFHGLGRTAERNALAMHATGMAAWPPVLFWRPESVQVLQDLWRAREKGLAAYATMDAGPNVKVLFLAQDEAAVRATFPAVKVIAPFGP